jgi:hypothetical protein
VWTRISDFLERASGRDWYQMGKSGRRGPGPMKSRQANDDDDDDDDDEDDDDTPLLLHEWLNPYIFNIVLIQSRISMTFFCLALYIYIYIYIYMQDGAKAHTANYSINVFNKVSEDSQITDVTCKACRLISVILICGET